MDTLTALKAMSDKEFDAFFVTLPPRVQLLVRGKMVAWQDVLPQYYERFINNLEGARRFHGVK